MITILNHEVYPEENNDEPLVIIGIVMTEDFYTLNNLDKEEYPENGWALFVKQDEEGREQKSLWIDIDNQGMSTDFILDPDEFDVVVDYIKKNNLDIEAGFILKKG